MATQWDWWNSALAGTPGTVTDGHVESGFYRNRLSKDGGWQPVAVWRDNDGTFRCRMGTKAAPTMLTEEQAQKRWTFFCQHPVKRNDYAAAYDTGEWPDGSPTITPATAKANAPADPYQAWKEEIDSKLESASAWLATTPIDDKTKADRARNTQAEILALIKRGEGMHKDEKAPVLRQSKEIDDAYLPLCKDAKRVADTLREKYGAFAAAEEARLRKAAQEKYEAEQKRVAEERAKLAAEQEQLMQDDPIAAMTSPAPEMPAMPPPPEPVKLNIGGGVGRAAGLKTEWGAAVTDHKAALAHFADHPDVVALVEKLAKSAVKAAKGSITIPGVEVTSRRIAA